MHIHELSVRNYKSFHDSGPLRFEPGINVIVGKNDAGKSALLEAAALVAADAPHKSEITKPTIASQVPSAAIVTLDCVVTGQDLDEFLRFGGAPALFIPAWIYAGAAHQSTELETLVTRTPVHFRVRWTQGSFGLEPGNESSLQIPRPAQQSRLSYAVFSKAANSDQYVFVSTHSILPDPRDIGIALATHLRPRFYRFAAQRSVETPFTLGAGPELEPNGSNLAGCLVHLLTTDSHAYRRYLNLVERVFPHIRYLSPETNRNHADIMLWSVDPAGGRSDLAVPLGQSGTGIAQVLAMLYVLVTARSPRVLAIDEPSSFLHPGALRVLLEIFREHQLHQYLLSTNTPELLAAASPVSVHLLKRDALVTTAQRIALDEAAAARRVLLDVGSRLSDVFSADEILWVEGPSEELAFPYIVERLTGRALGRRVILGVLHTGDFDRSKKGRELTLAVYQRLSNGGALIPPCLGFVFDREARTQKDIEELKSLGPCEFLPRRTFENYLLDSTALAAVMRVSAGFASDLSAASVQAWIDANKGGREFYSGHTRKDFPDTIDAPKFLNALFWHFSGETTEYRKTKHSVAICRWLVENKPDELAEIVDVLKTLLAPRDS